MLRTITIAATSAALALAGGVAIGRTMASPYVLSIQSTDYWFLANLYGEARSNGECVRLTAINSGGIGARTYWLRSC